MAAEKGEGITYLDGEPILYRARLSDRWLWMRACCGFAKSWWLPLVGFGYCACGQTCRQSEFDSFSLVVTPSAIHYGFKEYVCFQMCCQSTVRKTIPLDKILDVVVVSDCCGDRCGFAEHPGASYQLHVQTAAAGAADSPELSVFCVENPAALRLAILNAKKRTLLGAGAAKLDGSATAAPVAAGGGGGGSAAASSAAAPTADMRPVVAVLERMEAALNAHLAAVQRAGASAGAAK